MVHGSKSDTVSDLDPQPITVDLIKIPDSTVLPEPQPQALIKNWLSELDSPSLAAGYAADRRSNGRPRHVRMDPLPMSDLDPYFIAVGSAIHFKSYVQVELVSQVVNGILQYRTVKYRPSATVVLRPPSNAR